jgi:hypothetical protein
MTQQTKFVEILIKRDAILAIPAKVATWELPIIEAAHEGVEVVSEFTFDRPPPDVTDEFERLSQRYGRSENEDGSRGLPYVQAVYGQHGVGLGRLADAIKAATVEVDATEGLMGEAETA